MIKYIVHEVDMIPAFSFLETTFSAYISLFILLKQVHK